MSAAFDIKELFRFAASINNLYSFSNFRILVISSSEYLYKFKATSFLKEIQEAVALDI